MTIDSAELRITDFLGWWPLWYVSYNRSCDWFFAKAWPGGGARAWCGESSTILDLCKLYAGDCWFRDDFGSWAGCI